MKSSVPPAEVLFADIAYDVIEPDRTLPAKFKRLIKRFDLETRVKDKKVAVKMHFGGSHGYTTIHPVFVRILVEEIKAAGCRKVMLMDDDPENGIPRGYVPEVVGCQLVSCFGAGKKYLYREEIGFKKLDHVHFGGEVADADYFIDFSHIKGHGDCGFGGAIKNIAMGCTPPESRSKLHGLEGGLTYDKSKCTFCLKCHAACPNNAIQPDHEKRQIGVFFHNCTYCQHCVMICPTKAIVMEDRKFEDFTKGMALVTKKFLDRYDPSDRLFINVLTDITIFCDCWGMSTPSLVPDIGILASTDICAVEQATLDMIKVEDFLPKGMPKNRKLLAEGKHLFERIHAKDPYLMISQLEALTDYTTRYQLTEIK